MEPIEHLTTEEPLQQPVRQSSSNKLSIPVPLFEKRTNLLSPTVKIMNAVTGILSGRNSRKVQEESSRSIKKQKLQRELSQKTMKIFKQQLKFNNDIGLRDANGIRIRYQKRKEIDRTNTDVSTQRSSLSARVRVYARNATSCLRKQQKKRQRDED